MRISEEKLFRKLLMEPLYGSGRPKQRRVNEVAADVWNILGALLEIKFAAAEATREILDYEEEIVLNQRIARRCFEKNSSGVKTLERKKGTGRTLMDIDEALQEAVESNPSMSIRLPGNWSEVGIMETILLNRTSALIGSFPPEICQTTERLATIVSMPLVVWDCPTIVSEFSDNVHRVQPKMATVISAIVNVVKHLRYRSASIVSLRWGAWGYLSLALENSLLRSNVSVKQHITLFGPPPDSIQIQSKG
ncbi:unnamed protein product [Nezara viridula]|uniref:Uncharacterized protein n=1 Tax=Nezara viridula TaxID=85310 RepID=A0A9P0HMC0_NEZVI|nr:unnamed protein product [Nezara viridula]